MAISAGQTPRSDDISAREEHVRAATRSLSALLDRDPEARQLLHRTDPLPNAAGYRKIISGALSRAGVAELRREKRRRLLEIAARDLTGEIDLVAATSALSDLADACLDATLSSVGSPREVAVVSMGKLGARELNYCSDIDVIFVTDGDVTSATAAAERVVGELGGVAPEGQAFRIDVDLRPEGRSGALVRSVDAMLEYYRRWADDWEYQALIKARASAGNVAAAHAVIDGTRSLVFPVDVSPQRVASIRKMKTRVEEHALRYTRRARAGEERDVKRGPGGIRDIEFAIQLLQLVHGGSDPTVRIASTLAAITRLVEGGYIAEDDAAGMSVAYRWLRAVEHRIQLWQERQVHLLPTDAVAAAALARSLGFRDSPARSASDAFQERHLAVLADVRARFEKLFYRPMIESLAGGSTRALTQEALRERLLVFGFRDVERAARTLDGLVSGTSRRARLFRVLTPPFLRFVVETPLPDQGLFSFLTLGEALQGRVDALGALRDNPPALRILARVLGHGRILGDLLAQVPEELATIADPAGPSTLKPRERLLREASASLVWRDPDDRLSGLRRFKRREMLRVALVDVATDAGVEEVGAALSDVADACLQAALPEDVPLAVVAMGKLGGRELSYASDLDVMFVHEADPQQAERIAEGLMQALGEVTPEGQAFRMDAALRPEGNAGPLARSLEAFVEYYERWARPWELLALIKGRIAAGDADVGARWLSRIKPLAFPTRVPDGALSEIRHLKARMQRERIGRGVDPRRHIKLGPGALSDVEFAIQIVQLRHGGDRPSLRVHGTLDALHAARDAELLSPGDHERLTDAWRFLTRLRARLFLAAGRPVDVLPVKPEDAEAAGIAMGFIDQPRQQLEESYLRLTRRARPIADRLIFGD